MSTSWIACKKLNLITRLALVVMLAMIAAPARSAAGQEPDFTEAPRLVLKWKWGTGSGTAGLLNQPWSVIVDNAGIIYVVDTSNNRIQKYDAQGKLLLSWGSYGNEPGQFNSPQAIAFDRDGNLLVSDTLNWRIQRFTPAGKYLSTITSPIGFYYHRQLVVDGAGNIYVADATNSRIQKFDAAGNFLRTWKQANCPGFTPGGMALDGKGHLLVANVSCDQIAKFTLDGEFLSAWSPGPCCDATSQLGGLAIDSKGRLLAVDEVHSLVRIFTQDGTLLDFFGTYGSRPGELNHPAGITVGPGDNIYIADNENNRIQVFDSSGKYLWMITSDCQDCMNNPDGVATNWAGQVYMADSGNNRVLIFDRRGNFQGKIGSAGNEPGEFYFPNQNDLEIDACGNLYVADSWNNRIQKFDSEGHVRQIWQEAGGYDIALGEFGSVYLAVQDNQIKKFDSQGNLVLSWGGPGMFNMPQGLETDWDGNVWVGDLRSGQVQKFDPQGKYLLNWSPPEATRNNFTAEDFAIDPLGRIHILDGYGQRIYVIDRDGNFITEWSLSELTEGELGWPNGMAFDRWGNLYITDGKNGQVFRFQLRPYDVDVTDLEENNITGQVTASLSANAPENTDRYEYALVDGPGGEDNARFTIQGNQLIRLVAPLTDGGSYHIRVRVKNPWNDTYEKALQVIHGPRMRYFLPMIKK